MGPMVPLPGEAVLMRRHLNRLRAKWGIREWRREFPAHLIWHHWYNIDVTHINQCPWESMTYWRIAPGWAKHLPWGLTSWWWSRYWATLPK